MNKDKFLTLSGIILLLTISFVACSKPPASEPPTANENLPVSPIMPEVPVESEEPEERPIHISSLAYEVKYQLLMGSFESFLKKYPIELIESEWMYEYHSRGGGSLYMRAREPADNIYQAQIHLENASSLLNEGKLPTEINSEPLDKQEVAEELSEARHLLVEQQSISSTWEEEVIEWVKQEENPQINNEQTVAEVIETCDDYRQWLSEMITTLDRILSDLPEAIEG